MDKRKNEFAGNEVGLLLTWICSFSITTASSFWTFNPNWSKLTRIISSKWKQHWQISRHSKSSCSKLPYCSQTLIGPPLLLLRVDFQIEHADLSAAAPGDYDDNSCQEQSAAAAPAPAAAAGAAAGLNMTKPVWINLWILRWTCKHCPFVLCIFDVCLILLCIAFIQIGYEWPIQQESPCFEQRLSSFNWLHFSELLSQ